MEVLFTTEEQFALTIHWPNEDLCSDKVTDSNNFIRFLKYYYKQGGDLIGVLFVTNYVGKVFSENFILIE